MSINGIRAPSLRRTAAAALLTLATLAPAGSSRIGDEGNTPVERYEPSTPPAPEGTKPPLPPTPVPRPPHQIEASVPATENPIDRLGLPVGRISVTGSKRWVPISITREGEVKRESPEHVSLASVFDFWVPFYGDVHIDFHLEVRWYGTPDEVDIDIRNGDVYRRYIWGTVHDLPDGVKEVRSKYGPEVMRLTPDGKTLILTTEQMPEMEGITLEIEPLPG